jgi:hypothetical protein
MTYDNNSGYNNSGYSADNSASADQLAQSDLPYPEQGTDQGPGPDQVSGNPNPVTGNVAATTPTVLIYLNDGTLYAASDYWLKGGKLHYTVNYAGENSVDMDQVDLQRTVNENAKRGVRFSLKPSPDTVNSAPGSNTSTMGTPRNNQNVPAPATNPPAPQPAPRMQVTSQASPSQS